MAGRSTKSRAKPPTPAAVSDSELFPFQADALDTPGPQRSTRKLPRIEIDTAKPHYHDHRARLRQRFDDAGPDALADYELLEMLLFRTIPRRDTKPLAKALLAAFGDLAGVLAAPVQRIAEIDGAGAAVAQDLKLSAALHARAQRGEIKKRSIVSSWSQLINYCRTTMAHEPREQFRVLFLDVKNQMIADEVQNVGTIDHAPVYPREIVRRALELAAAAIILVHNQTTNRFSITADYALSH